MENYIVSHHHRRGIVHSRLEILTFIVSLRQDQANRVFESEAPRKIGMSLLLPFDDCQTSGKGQSARLSLSWCTALALVENI